MLFYREFYVRGAGREISINSDRNRPRLLLSAPIILNRFTIKTVEVPLTFSPLTIDPTDMSFTTTYTTNTGHSFSFIDYLTFDSEEFFDGTLLLQKMEVALAAHAAVDVATHEASTPGFVNNSTEGAFELSNTNLSLTLLDDDGTGSGDPNATTPFPNLQYFFGKPFLTMDIIPTTPGATDTTLGRCVIAFPAESQIANFTDFPYWNRPLEWVCDTPSTSPTNLITTNIEVPTLRTRPSYLLLHSNIRGGLQYYTTGRPADNGTTVIAKVCIRMDSTQEFGSAAQIWVNEQLHPECFYPGNDMEYSELIFWFTYPDGLTQCQFAGNNF